MNDPSISTLSTVAALKAAIASKLEIPPQRQRLIFRGKSLKPDESILSIFKIDQGACIHLFPLPEDMVLDVTRAQPTTGIVDNCVRATPTNGYIHQNNTTNSNRIHTNRQSYIGILGSRGMMTRHGHEFSHNPMHFDANIRISSSEVRGWCYLLTFLSATTLMNNFMLVLSKGILGHGLFDSVINIVESCLSMAGLYVSSLGFNSCQTLELQVVRRYCYLLCILGVASALEKCVWVLDIVFTVESEIGDADVSNFLHLSLFLNVHLFATF